MSKKPQLAPRPPAPSASDADWRTWAELWASWDPNEATRAALLAESPGSLRKLLGARLEFGTAGLRGPMGLGSAQMNDLVVLQTTQGVCAYLESMLGEAAPRRVCVGFDHRAGAGCTSRSFALQVAKVFLQRGFDVWLYRDFVATPLVPWAMERRGCCCGVMITASHNPKLDNGYKLYWSNCAQIIPPHDAKVAALIEENLEPWSQEALEVLEHPRCKDPVGEGLLEDYFHSLRRLKSAAPGKDLPVVYTAMHGVGRPFVERAFEAFGHRRPQVVAEQGDPDPEFPTVAFPNPEEGKGALALAFDLAAASGCDLVLANDPDADRLAAAERQPGGAWHVFTGNELGALLGHWAWRLWRQSHPDQSPDKVCMVASTVSSKFLGRVAATEGFRFVETLTGFKWMGSKSGSLRDQGFEVIFAFEEAIGFCVGDLVKDKDGISAAAVFVDMARTLRESNKRCLQHLEDLYHQYGALQSLNSYVKSPDPAVTSQLFAAQRGDGARAYPQRVGSFVVKGVRDLTVGYDSRQVDGKPELPLNLGGEMITYYFEDAEVTLRSSGTEPKIKWYSEMPCSYGESRLRELVKAVVCSLLDPVGNNLEIRPEDKELLQ